MKQSMFRPLEGFARLRRLVALASITCSGCSFAFVSGPPSETAPPPRPAETCTTSVLYPVLDTVGAAVGAVNIGIAANASPGKVAWYGVEMESGTGVALGITQLALFGAGAIYGFVQTSRCNAFLEAPEKESEGATWSPALANQDEASSSEASAASTTASSPPPRASAPAAPPAPPPAAPTSRPATATTSPATSPPSTSTGAFPD